MADSDDSMSHLTIILEVLLWSNLPFFSILTFSFHTIEEKRSKQNKHDFFFVKLELPIFYVQFRPLWGPHKVFFGTRLYAVVFVVVCQHVRFLRVFVSYTVFRLNIGYFYLILFPRQLYNTANEFLYLFIPKE